MAEVHCELETPSPDDIRVGTIIQNKYVHVHVRTPPLSINRVSPPGVHQASESSSRSPSSATATECQSITIMYIVLLVFELEKILPIIVITLLE